MKINNIRLVVFDWEGTLADTLGNILSVMSDQAQQLNLPKLDEQLAREYAGLGLIKAIQKLYPDITLAEQESFLHGVQKGLGLCKGKECLFTGALALVEKLATENYFLGIASNKGQQSLLKAIDKTGLSEYFPVVRTASTAPPKPCPQMLEEIMNEYGVHASETLMIGDTTTDIEMASALQVETLAVDFYHQQRDKLLAAGAFMVCDEYLQVAEYFGL